MFSEIDKEIRTYLPFVLTTTSQNQAQREIIRPYGFTDHQFIWVSEGEGHFTVEDTEYTLKQGEGLFFRANVPHTYNGEKGNFFTSWITFSGCDNILDYYNIGTYFRFDVSTSMNTLCTELNTLCTGNSTAMMRSAAGYSCLINVLEEIFETSIPIETRVKRFMENNYATPLSLDEIAQHVNMDRYALCRYYNKNCNIRPMEQLKKIRISKAKHYLKYTSKSVDEIGKLCGFDSTSYFGKRFKEETNFSPGEYRKQQI